jgi:tRNA(Ile)-lysidine synthase
MSQPTLETLALRCMRDEIRLPARARVLVAVSGGPDSMALLDVLARRAGELDVALVAHGVDHGLRQEASAELDLAEALAETHGVPFGRSRVRVARGGNLQARARDARWRALRDAAASARAKFIATAHHADDRAETVLIRLLRGSGPGGLAVLPPRDGDQIRPLLRARRADVEAHVSRRGLWVARDPSNDDPRFTRTRVRTELLPLMAELDPRVVEHLCSLADALEPARGDSHIYPLPRATQAALAALFRNPNPRSRILLPGGLVALHDPTHVTRTHGQVRGQPSAKKGVRARHGGSQGGSTPS